MALVAYDNSDSSEFEDEDNESATTVTLNRITEAPTISKPISSQDDVTESSPSGSLFNHLPQPTTKKLAVVEEDDEFLHRKEDVASAVKPKAKITVPSLSDFKDVENSITRSKPRVSNGKQSGLLSILPQPRNAVTATTKSLIPNILAQKPNNTNVKKKTLSTPMKTAKVDLKPLINDYSDDSDNEEVQNDFFSINKPMEIPVEAPLDIDINDSIDTQSSEKKPFNIEAYFKQNGDEDHIEQNYDTESISSSATDYGETSNSYNEHAERQINGNESVLDDEAILKLCGTRGKRKREEIQIVDVKQDEVLADARAMLLKGLMDDTTKRVSASKKKGNEPTNQQKRKHQITYLAFQAKANEAELQNQWANNRMSKRQTQSKYGF